MSGDWTSTRAEGSMMILLHPLRVQTSVPLGHVRIRSPDWQYYGGNQIDVMLVNCSIDSPFGSDSASLVVRLSQTRPSIRSFSLYNLHGDGVEHPDKTLLLNGIGRRQMVHLIEAKLLIASLALNIDLDGKFFC